MDGSLGRKRHLSDLKYFFLHPSHIIKTGEVLIPFNVKVTSQILPQHLI